MKKRREINIACHVFNAFQCKMPLEDNKRRRRQWKEFKAIQWL